ncbi:S8 family peptidase [Streptomyces sp. NPDC051362]|uniref:S8 family peptidase n=1 Tax=Streptomyces sp. NPDC051362 TaxID=3365651 RepID=UPI0037B1C917
MLLVATTPSASLALGASTGTASSSNAVLTPPHTQTPHADKANAPGTHRWIPLVTGDRIAVNAKNEMVSVRPAKGREDIPIHVETLAGHTYALPGDAMPLIESGRLDRRLFDITTLNTPDYAQRRDLRLIVTYDRDHSTARSTLRSSGGAAVQRALASINADAISAPANGTADLWTAITARSGGSENRTIAPGIASVWLDAIVPASLDKSVPQIGGPEAWAAGFDGTGTRIAVLDSGVDTTHADLAQQVIAERNFSQSPTAGDLFGHGTHVASIAAGTGAKSGGKYKGVAPGARLLNGKVLGDNGSGSMSQIIAGMEWAVSEKADVANLSLGTFDSPEMDPLEEAVNNLSAQSGTLFVVAAGNSGALGSGTINTPGSADAALTVGAVDKQDVLAPFSSTGPRAGDNGIKPDLTAPGVDIGAAAAHDSRMADEGTPVADGYVALSGTSMATPHVAGAAAILAQQHPNWTGADIKQALVNSTTPGKAYTPYQEGSGRVDLRRAIKQTVLTRETSLPFGLAQWPHTDDQPIVKNVTYRNVGDTPVNLKLAVTGTAPDGSAAPSGMFTAANEVQVPAHGEASVKVTADTRLGGDTVGNFTGRITATGDGQTVSTALAVEREAEMYTVAVKTLDHKGKTAAAGSWDATLVGLTGTQRNVFRTMTADSPSVRVPRGRYYLTGTQRVDQTGSTSQVVDWFNQPVLEVGKDTTVTLDGRTTKPIDVTVPDHTAQQTLGSVSANIKLSDGYSFNNLVVLQSFKNLRTAHVGPKAASGDEFTQRIEADFSTGSQGHDEYEVLYEPKGDRYLTGFTAHPQSREFASFRTTVGAPAKGKIGYVSMATAAGGGVTVDHALPFSVTLHLLSEDTTWWVTAHQSETNHAYNTRYESPALTVKPGHSYHRYFNIGVFGPDLPPGAALTRNGDTMDGALPLFSDSKGNTNDNNSPIANARINLYRNGDLVKTSIYPSDFFYIAEPKRAQYRLTLSVERGPVADVSTSLNTEWTFSSGSTQRLTNLPISVVRFTPDLSLDSSSKARAKVQVPVAVKGAAAGRNLKSLNVWVSVDKGTHWKRTIVHNGRAQVANPKAGDSVSFKATAVDRQGNSVTQTILDAYLAK